MKTDKRILPKQYKTDLTRPHVNSFSEYVLNAVYPKRDEFGEILMKNGKPVLERAISEPMIILNFLIAQSHHQHKDYKFTGGYKYIAQYIRACNPYLRDTFKKTNVLTGFDRLQDYGFITITKNKEYWNHPDKELRSQYRVITLNWDLIEEHSTINPNQYAKPHRIAHSKFAKTRCFSLNSRIDKDWNESKVDIKKYYKMKGIVINRKIDAVVAYIKIVQEKYIVPHKNLERYTLQTIETGKSLNERRIEKLVKFTGNATVKMSRNATPPPGFKYSYNLRNLINGHTGEVVPLDQYKLYLYKQLLELDTSVIEYDEFSPSIITSIEEIARGKPVELLTESKKRQLSLLICKQEIDRDKVAHLDEIFRQYR